MSVLKVLTEDEKLRIALCRYDIISPLLGRELPRGAQNSIIRDLTSKFHENENKELITVGHRTVTGDSPTKTRLHGVSIPRQHKDIAFRSLSATFKDEVIDIFGLKLPKVVDIAQTSVPLIEIKDRNMDTNLILENNTVLHVEFESSEPTEDDQIRYGHYDLELYRQRRQYIHRLIVYGAGVKNDPVPLDIGAVRQSQKFVHLEQDYNVDEIFRQIQNKIEHEILLNSLDKFHITLIPMMKSQECS